MVSTSESFEKSFITKHTWHWKGFEIAYQSCGNQGKPVILVHGFGANSGHWRQNLPILGQNCRCYALDLIGFGNSAKPTPGSEINYTFETWGQQVTDFVKK
jgi:pimeloyl-ACP methyl ester carboxylesterase